MKEEAFEEYFCSIRGCSEEYPLGRHEIGYRTCFKHSHLDSLNSGLPPLVLMDVNKSNPTITRSPRGFLTEVYADRPVRSELRQTRSYVRLNSINKEDSHL